MASVATWSQTAASNTSLGGISTDGNVTLVNQIDNIFRGMMAEVATSRDDGTIIAVYPRGYLHGLTLSNNAGDATNDIDIAIGEAVTLDAPYWRMALAAPITKRLDAAWAVGTGNGGLDTGSIANTTYHVWLIQRSDTLVVDVLFSTSATAPTMPANYDRKRRIGSIIRSAGAIRLFLQKGDSFKYTGGVLDRSSTATTGAILIALSVPTGISVGVILNLDVGTNATSGVIAGLGDAAAGNVQGAALSIANANTGAIRIRQDVGITYFTNTSAQIYFSLSVSFGTASACDLYTQGWIDTRGRAL